MDILLSTVLGELTTRSINFFIKKSLNPKALDVEDRLHMILLRAQVIIDEAMGRQITNQYVLQMLDMLRDAMYRGCYTLDTFRYQVHNEEEAKDPKMHPRLACQAMEMARMSKRCFIAANMFACLLRDNFDIEMWCKVLAFTRGQNNKNILNFGGHPFDLVNQKRPAYLARMVITPPQYVVLHCENEYSKQEELPNIKFQDVLYGSIKVHGKFEMLGWRSRIPPYHSFVGICEFDQEVKITSAKRKRSV
ncbi:hypothetical protein SEVIR_2G011301v4 [Setaria viridis]|uniref:Disease resistance N-terminal domain-containing protein n=1 Tax=Setaria viridis TaxID=4556 RepID=A0A4U6VKE4_SETVI|nr:hypothetical protein SEVIR_2G011301v2 [Setaria viridis]